MKVPRWFVAAIAVVIVFAVPAGASASVSFVRAFGSHGAGDGQLADPEGIAIDGSNVFVVDGSSDRVVEFTTDGAFVRTWGWGVADGQHQLETCTSGCQNGISGSGDGQLTAPEGVAVSGGNVYVADSDDNRVVEYGSTGTFIRAWAVNSPYGIGTTPDGHLLVTDTADNTVQEFASDGTSVDTLATTWGSGDKLHFPDAVATAANGDIYVLDDFNQRVVQFSPAGSFVSAFGTSGTGSGQFQFPQGIAVDSNGHVVVSDTGNARLEGFDADGNFIESFGSAGSGNGQFNEPHGLAAGADGELAVADGNNFRVQLLNTAGGGEPSQHTLTVARAGTGSGTVTSTPAGIDCGSTCSVPMDAGDVVTLVPAPAPGSLFTGWSGGCTGIAACQITLDQDTAVTARFSQLVPDLTKAPAFQRIVAAVPAGALAPALHASSKLTLVGRATLAVDRHHRRTRTELRCAAATGKTCVVKATLSARIGRRKATLGTSTSRIAG